MKEGQKTVFKIIFLIYIAVVAYACFGNFTNVPNLTRAWLGIPNDKILHFLMFLPFPILMHLSFGHKRRNPWRAMPGVIGIFIIGCLIAAGTEVGQSFLSYRSCDPTDFIADSLALLISSLIVFIMKLW